MTLTDEQLLKFADGQLDAQAAAAVADALAADEVATERLRLIQLSGAYLTAEASRPLPASDTAILSRLENSATHPADARAPSAPLLRRSAMAAAFALIIGVAGGYWGHAAWTAERSAERHPVWVMRVVDYHTLYGRATVDGSASTPSAVQALEARLSVALGRAVKVPLYDASMEFRRGQLLEFERAPIVQLAYLPPGSGAPMALCFKRQEGADSQPMYERIHGIGMVRWQRGGLAYVLVGDQSERDLLAYANGAISQIDRAG